ncbi:hypothetical protein BVY02_00795 [bacterium J17]|nr:hypothetical protein BVY02_00795 [bacterium J17]
MVLAFVGYLVETLGIARLEDIYHETLDRLPLIVCGVIFLVIAYKVGRLVFSRPPRTVNLNTFKYIPEEFDRSIIKLTGKVQKVLKDTMGEKIKRKTTDVVRNMTGNEDKVGRYMHQRFVISSPQLKPGETTIVYHNLKSEGRLKLKVGKWVEIQGEYIHDPGANARKKSKSKNTNNSVRNSRTYGLIHYTHSPKGYAKVLSKKPKDIEYKEVTIVKDNRENPLPLRANDFKE